MTTPDRPMRTVGGQASPPLDDARADARQDPGADEGVMAQHDVDRGLDELLEEVRIAQMGAQIMLGFLLAVAYTTVLRETSEPDRDLYAWAIVVTTTAVVLLLAPVPLHRLNFGRRARPQILVVGHVLSVLGLVALAGAIVLSVWLAARIALPADVGIIVLPVSVLVVVVWFGIPLSVRVADARRDAAVLRP